MELILISDQFGLKIYIRNLLETGELVNNTQILKITLNHFQDIHSNKTKNEMYLPLVKCWWALILKEFLLLCLFVYWICFIMLFKGSHLHKKKSDKFCETYSIFCNSLPIHLTSLQLGGEAEIRAWLSEVGTFSQVSMTIFTQIILPFQIWRWLPLGAGRGGRKTQTGKRNRVLVYILFNSSDIAGNVF